MELFDLHCHLDLTPSMLDLALEIQKADIGVLAVTTTPKAYEKEVPMLRPFSNIRVALGLHPHLAYERYIELSLIEKYIEDAKYIGEIGLDFNRQYYYSKEKQIDVFENAIRSCSLKGGKVISVHSVHSDRAVLDILEKHYCTEKNKCILHWFSGSITQLHRAVEMGCYFSINNEMIKSPNGRKLIANIPLDNILVETDAPFINEVKNIQCFRDELAKIESSLVSVFGAVVLDLIHTKSKEFLSLDQQNGLEYRMNMES